MAYKNVKCKNEYSIDKGRQSFEASGPCSAPICCLTGFLGAFFDRPNGLTLGSNREPSAVSFMQLRPSRLFEFISFYSSLTDRQPDRHTLDWIKRLDSINGPGTTSDNSFQSIGAIFHGRNWPRPTGLFKPADLSG
ncbi:calcium-dependent secretion activator 1 [Trichinella spiralis]|uniref:calcium-dependent secretion activator 1 n=1 Tax=Trichinella spiralis TaxID=6334 RepID=UPI0001EFC726|nr:calcium-dependent secretion activator 1 [Trichinella spiralis]